MDLFAGSFARSSALEGYCLAGFNVPPGGGRLVRFVRLATALRNAVRWCERNRFIDKTFIIREFSTWALLLSFWPAWRARKRVGYNINHNLAGRASYVAVDLLSRFLNIYYLSGSAARHPGMPKCVKVIDVSSAYPLAPQRKSGACVVILPRRGDQYQLVDTGALAQAVLSVTNDVQWVGLEPNDPALAPAEYRELIGRASCVVLAYHQGFATLRHSGVIWDAMLAGTTVLVPETNAFVAQAGPAVGVIVLAYGNADELALQLQRALS